LIRPIAPPASAPHYCNTEEEMDRTTELVAALAS
jgi:hypothetical protein